jgi:hypothetical protein
VKKYNPKLARIAEENSLAASIGLMVLINFAMFASYSSYFFTEKIFVLQTTLASFLLYAAYGLIVTYLSFLLIRAQQLMRGFLDLLQ